MRNCLMRQLCSEGTFGVLVYETTEHILAHKHLGVYDTVIVGESLIDLAGGVPDKMAVVSAEAHYHCQV